MTAIHAIILGIVEGLTEFLPISSTGHLILASNLLKIPESDFLKTFEISIQLGAVLAVLFLYWKTISKNPEVLKKLIVAFAPTAVIGLIFYKLVKRLLGSPSVVLWSLLLGGILIIIFEKFHKEKTEATISVSDITFKQAFFIGLFQSIALIPGVSRAAATIIGGLVFGLNRETTVKFSFLLALPTMFAATALDIFKSNAILANQDYFLLGLGGLVSFLSAVVSIKFLIRYISSHKFTTFGIYRVILSSIFLALK